MALHYYLLSQICAGEIKPVPPPHKRRSDAGLQAAQYNLVPFQERMEEEHKIA
jgi:hypothetical protein